MVRTLLSDHTRLAAGAIVGAVTAALFIEGLLGGPAERSGPGDRAAVSEGTDKPDPLPAVVDVPPPTTVMSTTSSLTSTTTTTTTTTSKRSSTTTTTTTTIPPTTTTTTVRPTTTTTTTRTCRILC